MRAVEYYEKQIAAETDESKKKKLFVDWKFILNEMFAEALICV